MAKALARIYRGLVFLLKKTGLKKILVDLFHVLYYTSTYTTWANTYWLGTKVYKNPCDLWIYQEVIFEIKPDIIIECGTQEGGSAFYFASLCDLVGNGLVITIDIRDHENRPTHERITYLLGSSTDREIVEQVRELSKNASKILVVLDSDHSMKHVSAELTIYSELVTVGSYIVVEDSDINGHPVDPRFGPGPMEAINQFLNAHKNFTVDSSKEKHFLTFNPRGFLKKISP